MLANIIVILACVPLYVINSFCDKAVSAKSGNKYNLLYNCAKFAVCGICTLPMLFSELPIAFSLGSVICGTACGLMYAVSKTVMLKGYETTSVAFMTLCHSSGMIIPCIVGHFLWSEKLNLLAVIGIIITIFAIVLLKDSKSNNGKFHAKGIIFGLIIFLTSGGVMITQKAMGIYYNEEGIAVYMLFSFVVPMVLLLFLSKPQAAKGIARKEKKSIAFCAVSCAISLSVISFVMTGLASSVPSVILFPLFNGLGIITVCIGSAFVFKEKMTTKNIIGLIFGILGLYIINLQ